MHRSRCADFDLTTNAQGHIQPRNYFKASMIELDSNFSCDPPTVTNSINFDFKSSSSKKKTKAPIRSSLAEDMSTEKQIRRSSPTVIAKLMGLDSFPSPGSVKPKKEVKTCSQKLSYKDFQEMLTRHDCLLKECNDVHQEFKDVFEVVEEPKVENHMNQDIRKRRFNVKQCEMGMAFIRQSFINAKRLSTDEKLQRSKEFDTALEVFESNKDLFLKLLQEPHSLFSKHFQDLSYSPHSPQACHALIQKSSRNSQTANCESSLRSEIKDKRSINLQISDSQPPKKPAVKTLSDSMYVEKVEDDAHAQPTDIVILKPSLAKARKVERTARSVKSWGKQQYGVINHRELLKKDVTEERGQPKFDTMENSRLMKKHTIELSKDAQRGMSSSTTGRMVSIPKYSNYVQEGGLWPTPSIADGINSPTSYCTSDNVYEHGKIFSPSSSSAIEHLSEQWRLNHKEIGLSMRASGTLGEMLAFSDNETSNRAQDTSDVKKACPLSISGKDGWKDGFSRNLPRSKSLPASSLVYGSWNDNSRNRFVGSKSRFMPKNVHNMSTGTLVDDDLVKPKNSSLKSLSDGKGFRLPAREIHVSSEEFEHKPYVVPLAKEEHTARNLSGIHSAGAAQIFSVPSGNIAVPSLLMKDKSLEKFHKATRSERNGKHSECGFSDMLSKQASAKFGIDELLPSYCTRSVSVSPDSYREADQPSPVSVLDLSSKEDQSTSGFYKKISTDLQDLRMQLQFLKSDSTDGLAEEIEAFISCDEDSGDTLPHLGDMLQAFRDEEDRDYSFLLDMLIDSGIMKSDKIELFCSCQLTELPVSIDVFNKLEKKYKSVDSWSISERKLLFDLINSSLADISAALFMNMCPWMKPSLCRQSKVAYEGLVEEIWQGVVKCRKEISSICSEDNVIGPRWIDGGDDFEMVGKEVGDMLSVHLMDQLVTELIYM